jgi:hypothetical protein
MSIVLQETAAQAASEKDMQSNACRVNKEKRIHASQASLYRRRSDDRSTQSSIKARKTKLVRATSKHKSRNATQTEKSTSSRT